MNPDNAPVGKDADVINLGGERDRVKVDISVKSYILIEHGLKAAMREAVNEHRDANEIGDEDARKAAQTAYYHAKNLLKKFRDGRSISE